MFEQSVLPAAHTNTRAAFVAVTAAEMLAIACAVIVPLFLIGRPTVPKLPVVMRFQPRHVELIPVSPERVATQAPLHRVLDLRRLVAPVRVPSRVMDLRDIAPPDPGVLVSEPGGNPTADVGGPLLNRAAAPTPPPLVNPTVEKPTHPVRVSQGVQEAKLIKKVVPVYPEIARSIRQFGTVRLLAVIGKDGHIHDVQVLGGPAYLVTAAVAAVEQWVYKPTLLNGDAVEVIAPITVTFTLGQ
jgi:protein TonB